MKLYRLGHPSALGALSLLIALAAAPEQAQAQSAPHGAPSGANKPGEPSLSAEGALRAASIARQTMSPFCPGRTLADCPSEYATEWRRDIREMVARGLTSEQIQIELSSRAGGDLSGIPNRDASYALPLALGAGALVLLGFIFVRLKGSARPKPPSSTTAAPGASETADAPVAPADSPAEPDSPIDDQRLAAELDAEEDDSER